MMRLSVGGRSKESNFIIHINWRRTGEAVGSQVLCYSVERQDKGKTEGWIETWKKRVGV